MNLNNVLTPAEYARRRGVHVNHITYYLRMMEVLQDNPNPKSNLLLERKKSYFHDVESFNKIGRFRFLVLKNK